MYYNKSYHTINLITPVSVICVMLNTFFVQTENVLLFIVILLYWRRSTNI